MVKYSGNSSRPVNSAVAVAKYSIRFLSLVSFVNLSLREIPSCLEKDDSAWWLIDRFLKSFHLSSLFCPCHEHSVFPFDILQKKTACHSLYCFFQAALKLRFRQAPRNRIDLIYTTYLFLYQTIFLIALWGGFRNFFIAYKLHSHFISSVFIHCSSSAILPPVFFIISSGSYLSSPNASRYSLIPLRLSGTQRSSKKPSKSFQSGNKLLPNAVLLYYRYNSLRKEFYRFDLHIFPYTVHFCHKTPYAKAYEPFVFLSA